MSATGVQLIIDALSRGPLRVLGYAATADSIGTNYIDDDSEFSYSGYGDTEFQDRFIWRYNLAGTEDEVKQVTTVDTDLGRIYIGSVDNYADQTDLDYMLLGIHPADLMACLATGQRKQYREKLVMLNVGHDFDMLTPGTDYWDGTSGGSAVSNLTPTKTTVTANLYGSLEQSLLLTATGANGYARGEQVRVQAQRSLTTAFLVRADVGSVTCRLWDVEHAAYLNTGYDVAYSGEDFAMVIRQDMIPDGCEQVQPHLLLTGATDIAVCAGIFGPFDPLKGVFTLPTWLNEGYKLPFVRRSRYTTGIANSNQVFDAYSRKFDGDYSLGQHYEVEAFSNPPSLSFENGVSLPQMQPLWLAAQRSVADYEPMLYPSSVTTQPYEQVMAYFMWELADMLEGKRKEDPRWPKLKAEQTLNAGMQTAARPGPQAQPQRRIIRVGI